MPRASIIIPCYNAERFVEATVNSAQRQSVDDIEIICVDDGSSDATLKTLKRIAGNDSRIRIIERENGGEGPARDAGLDAATSPWLYFLDSDDLMEPTLLEESISVCERDQSDIAIFKTITLDMQTGEEQPCWYSFQREWMPNSCFRPQDHPQHVFTSFQNWVHNKLFRASFVHDHDLHMQHVHRTADLLFTCRALAEANRISLIDKPLHKYRINNPQSALATSDSYPLDFYEAFLALRTSLEQHDTWELYHDSFVNWAIHGVASNLMWARSHEGFKTIDRTMRTEGLVRLDIPGFPRERSDNLESYDLVRTLVEGTSEETLFWIASKRAAHISELETEASGLRVENSGLHDTLSAIVGSASFRVGRSMTSLPRSLRDRFVSRKGNKRTR